MFKFYIFNHFINHFHWISSYIESAKGSSIVRAFFYLLIGAGDLLEPWLLVWLRPVTDFRPWILEGSCCFGFISRPLLGEEWAPLAETGECLLSFAPCLPKKPKMAWPTFSLILFSGLLFTVSDFVGVNWFRDCFMASNIPRPPIAPLGVALACFRLLWSSYSKLPLSPALSPPALILSAILLPELLLIWDPSFFWSESAFWAFLVLELSIL